MKRKPLPPRPDGKPRRKLRKKRTAAELAAAIAKKGSLRTTWEALFKSY